MKLKHSTYIVINKANVKSIAQRLRTKGGSILIVEAGHRSFKPDLVIDSVLDLFQNCRIGNDSVQASWSGDWVNGQEEIKETKQSRDRHYWLRRKDKPCGDTLWDNLVDSRENLTLTDNYRFEISPQCIVSRGYLDDGSVAFYIPSPRGLKDCFTFALTAMVKTINEQAVKRDEHVELTEQHIATIVEYMLDDLQTGSVMRNNLKHGLMADALLGM